MSSALLIIERNEQILSLLYQENRLIQVKVHEKREDNLSSLPLNAIYIGKVKNVVPSIDAAFVEVCNGQMGFLPMKYAKNPIIVNRKYDGRIVAGDEILVQIEKEGIKTKDPGLTCNLSFAGKYCVLTTGKHNIGYSSKLHPRIKDMVKKKFEEWNLENTLHDENVGIVVRTNVSSLMDEVNFTENEAGVDNNGNFEDAFKSELDTLFVQKRKVLDSVSYRTCFSCLYQPIEGYLLDIRDTYEDAFDKIVTNNSSMYHKIREEFPYMDNVELYEDSRISLEKLYSVDTRLKEALDERVWLKSGAYLIIQQTEALTVIDVNSGKIQKKNPKDDIYFEINKEAAREIAIQLQLRNLSGIIIIDFISHNTKEQDNELLSYLNGLVKKDSVKTNVIDMTSLGLVEVTRKKIHKSLKEQLKYL
ncbi:MAG: ribonuclease E/G [Lachnospiraceae bacterium]|nr:ribonuclease E/G [Lachnospiraceae bacterium]